jgi:putative copper export protein
MKILVYGAGLIGSLHAARLQRSGHAVTLLARGGRGEEIRAHGLVLEDASTFLHLEGPELVLWVHVLAATIWIGGQATIALLLPLLRGQPGLVSAAGRRFQRMAWIAFAVLLLTGVLNMHDAGIAWNNLTATAPGRTLLLKLGFVALSGAAAAIHAVVVAPRAASAPSAATRSLSAVLGFLSLAAAALAALYGVIIAAG